MKNFVIVVFNLLITFDISCQTANEIWCALPGRYQSLSNYVDQGEYSEFFYGDYPSTRILTYYLAIDSNQNVYHNFYEQKGFNSWGYEYQKSADQKEGMLTREYGEHETLPRSLGMACASLVGGGCGMLDMVASLMVKDLYESGYENSGPIFRYDSLFRSKDTLLNNELHFVLEVYSSYYLSLERIVDTKRRQDSINDLHHIPLDIRRYPDQVAGFRKFLNRYFIRQIDGLICRRESFSFSKEKVKVKFIYAMNPKINVTYFQNCLKSWNKN